MGIALDSNELAPNYKEMWLNYLDLTSRKPGQHAPAISGKRNNYRVRIVRPHE